MNRRGGTRFVFGINSQPMKFKGFKTLGNPFRGVIFMQEGGIKTDPMGYWNPDNIGKPVIIPSNKITMKGVKQPLIGISDIGEKQLLIPGRDYEFEGESVLELPLRNPYKMQQGGFSIQDAYNFLFNDDLEAQNTAPSEEDIELVKQEQFEAGQREAGKKYEKQLRRQKNKQLNDEIINSILSFGNQNINTTTNPYKGTTTQGTSVTPSSTPVQYAGKISNNKSVDEKGKYVMNYLQSKHGLPKHVAAAITGNIYKESGFRPTVWGDQGTSFGLVQWRNERNKGLKNWANKNGRNIEDIDTQLDYIVHEAKQRGDLQAIMNISNPRDAAYMFAKKFERPAIIDNIRLDYATKAFNQFELGGTYDVDIPTLLKLQRQGYKYKFV